MNKKFTLVTALSSIIASSLLVTALFVGRGTNENHLQKAETSNQLISSNHPYVDETLPVTDDDNLFIAVTNATKTDLGESFSIRFSANTVLYPIGTTGTRKYPSTTGVYVTPDDENYPSDKLITDLTKYDVDVATVTPEDEAVYKNESGEAVVGDNGRYVLVDGRGYIDEMPIYTSYVSRINGTNTERNNINTIVIPYVITYGTWFSLRVTGFGENVIFNDRNLENPYDGIKTIVIGNNIEKIPENALPGAPADLVVKSTFEERPSDWNENFTNAKVEFGYVPNETDEKPIFDTDPMTDEEGNVLYYDNLGARLDAEGKYLDEAGNVIQEENEEGEMVDKVYEGTPITKPKAYEFKAVNPLQKSSDQTFVIGNIDEARGINAPLLMQYDVTLPSGGKESRIFECPIDSSYGYEAVGSESGTYAVTKNIDIRLNEGEDIDDESIRFYNIFAAKTVYDETNFEIYADLEHPYRNIPSITFANKIHINDFFKISFGSIKQVFGYTAISLKVDLVEGIYEIVKSSTYKNYEARILAGKYKVRYSFRDFDLASYVIEQGEDKFVVKLSDCVVGGIPGDLDYHIFKQKKNNDLTFIFDNSKVDKKLDMSKVTKVELTGFKVSLDLCPTDRGATQIVTKSGISFRFGYMDLLQKDAKKTFRFNGDLFLILYSLIFVALYVGGSVAYYFYAKNKYKNDEFRRINGKAYIKRMAKAFIGALLIAGAIAFIILRFILINPSVIMFNPLDVFVIIFGVTGLIAFGYFVKFLVLYIRQEKERRKIMRLKLNEEVENDGTN